jgi:nitrate reductase beta subunit
LSCDSWPEKLGGGVGPIRVVDQPTRPTCVAACPSGAIYKREEDGIVLIDQDKCRGWRMCVSACPYKKIYYNWSSGKSEKCTFCFPRIEAGLQTVCSETCVGRIRYLGVVLYDADQIQAAASAPDIGDLYEEQLKVFLDPHDPKGASAGPHRRDLRSLVGICQAFASVGDGDGLEDRLPAAP